MQKQATQGSKAPEESTQIGRECQASIGMRKEGQRACEQGTGASKE
jgi:hypothetical protein